MVVMLRTAPGRSSASSVRSSGRSAATPSRTPMHAISAIGALTTSSHSQRTWASAVPPSSGPRTKPDMPTTIITVIGAHAQRLVVEEPEDQRVGDRRHRRGGDAERGAQGDELARRADDDDAQAEQAEHGESDQQHASASEPVGHRAGGEQQAAEGQRVGAGDPLQRGRAARRGRGRSWAARSTAACCRPSRRRRPGRGRPAGSTPRAGTCRCVTGRQSSPWW